MAPPTPPERLPLDRWLAALDGVRVRRLRVAVTPRRPGRLEAPVGAVVRGLLGERLRELRCLTGAPACEGCPEVARCDHHRLFDRAHDAQETRAFWLQGVTHDAAVPDAPFEASLCTWSADDPALPYLDVALRDALARVGDKHRPPNLLGPTRADAPPWAPPVPSAARVTLVARSPLSLRGNLEAATALCPGVPELGLLVRAGVRRLDALLRVSGMSAPPRVAWPTLTDVRRVGAPWSWWTASRYSHRQERRQPLEGYDGALTVEGDGVAALGPLLHALSVSGVGRHTAYGLGVLALEHP